MRAVTPAKFASNTAGNPTLVSKFQNVHNDIVRATKCIANLGIRKILGEGAGRKKYKINTENP
jgi:hypothetical protein